MVEYWSPKPKVKGSSPFLLDLDLVFCSLRTLFFLRLKIKNLYVIKIGSIAQAVEHTPDKGKVSSSSLLRPWLKCCLALKVILERENNTKNRQEH